MYNIGNKHSHGDSMETTLKEAKQYKKGDFILIDDVVCRVTDVSVSKPGKHGSAKARIVAVSLLDGKKKEITKPGDAKIPAPIIDKRDAQVVMINDENTAQIMDLETYEMIDAIISDDVKGNLEEGVNVEYWVVGSSKIIMRVKRD